jgi:hypothetical protein
MSNGPYVQCSLSPTVIDGRIDGRADVPLAQRPVISLVHRTRFHIGAAAGVVGRSAGAVAGHRQRNDNIDLCDCFSLLMRQPRGVSRAIVREIARRMASSE